jgi:NADH-quinone oxidoreductase subunit G
MRCAWSRQAEGDSRQQERCGAAIGVIGSNRTTNEENYLLQKFARTVLQTNNIDHERTADYAAFARALAGHKGKAASLRDTATAPAILLIGGNPTEEHPLLAWNLRTNVRLNRARLYVANTKAIKLERHGQGRCVCPPTATLLWPLSGRSNAILDATFREAVLAEESLLVVFGSEYSGAQVAELVPGDSSAGMCALPSSAAMPTRAARPIWGCFPDLLPGYVPVTTLEPLPSTLACPQQPARRFPKIFDAAGKGELGALLVVGADPVAKLGVNPEALKKTFVIVADIFLTETAALADVVFPQPASMKNQAR